MQTSHQTAWWTLLFECMHVLEYKVSNFIKNTSVSLKAGTNPNLNDWYLNIVISRSWICCWYPVTVAAPLKCNNITKVTMTGPSTKQTTNFQTVEWILVVNTVEFPQLYPVYRVKWLTVGWSDLLVQVILYSLAIHDQWPRKGTHKHVQYSGADALHSK